MACRSVPPRSPFRSHPGGNPSGILSATVSADRGASVSSSFPSWLTLEGGPIALGKSLQDMASPLVAARRKKRSADLGYFAEEVVPESFARRAPGASRDLVGAGKRQERLCAPS